MKKLDLKKICKDSKAIAIGGHVRPDGDCVGSCLGVYHLLKNTYPEKEVQVYLEFVPESIKLLPGADTVKNAYDTDVYYDTFIALDNGSEERLGFSEPVWQKAKTKVEIDHHISNTYVGEHVLIDAKASAACEIVADLIDDEDLTLEIAQCLYLGIVHDTGVFKHNNTTEHTMCVAGRLLAKGVDTEQIINQSFYQKTYVQNQILGRSLLESFLTLDRRVIISVITNDVLTFYGASSQDIDGVIDQLNVTEGIEASVLIYEYEIGKFKISLRSHHIVDVSTIAKALGGGGHIHAAGFNAEGNWHDIINNILELMILQLEGQTE
ncbi:MAG: bifunctional oligoribonuclease/PAP phosphatase NrnA [Lachnospiraceae bacterium]|nr:bifunctional oligoribonuclease/PAP phosphatase NrnA [Lachnospiraceae bacterium]